MGQMRKKFSVTIMMTLISVIIILGAVCISDIGQYIPFNCELVFSVLLIGVLGIEFIFDPLLQDNRLNKIYYVLVFIAVIIFCWILIQKIFFAFNL